MAKLTWDQAGERLYEIGLDRGVLYFDDDNNGVAWNGLVSIDEDTSDSDSSPVYFDGMKVNDNPSFGDYSATLTAFTYPDEFLEFEGIVSLGGGLYVDGQVAKQFGLSYRTLIGNDIEGSKLGYKVHLVYNLTAIPDPTTFETLSDSLSASNLSWKISAVPEPATGHRATAHVILDSRLLPPDLLETIEGILYGTEGFFPGQTIYDGGPAADVERETIDGGTASSYGDELPSESTIVTSDPRLPSINELLDLIVFFGPRTIVPNTVTGIAHLIHGGDDLTPSNVAGVYSALPDTHLVPSDVLGYYELVL